MSVRDDKNSYLLHGPRARLPSRGEARDCPKSYWNIAVSVDFHMVSGSDHSPLGELNSWTDSGLTRRNIFTTQPFEKMAADPCCGERFPGRLNCSRRLLVSWESRAVVGPPL